MKKGILLVAIATIIGVSFTSCENKKNKLWDPNAKISLRAADGVPSGKGSSVHLTAKEIVEQTTNIEFINPKLSGDDRLTRGFTDNQRDFVNNRLLMNSTDIISYDGTYNPSFIEGQDVRLTTATHEAILDTIAYIPNKTLRDAAAIIKQAYDAEEYDLVYATFDQAFRFIPITGAEWLELKRQGKN